MKVGKIFLVWGLAAVLIFSSNAWAYGQQRADAVKSGSGFKTIGDAQDSFLANIRIIEQKKLAQLLSEQPVDQRRTGVLADTKLVDDTFTRSVDEWSIIEKISTDPNASAIYSWFSQNQKASPLGLVESYPTDSAQSDQAFTYDQALSGILLIKQGDTASAKKIFDFYNSNWDSAGFWTVYNSQQANGSKVEYLKIMGPSAWVGLFSLHYYKASKDSKALSLATKIGYWIKSLPHQNGGVAMGNSDIWVNLYSVENNISYFVLANALSTKASTLADRQAFQKEKNGLINWFKTQAYDSTTGLFKRGTGDSIKALDVNSWAVLVFGPAALSQLGINTDPNNTTTSNLVRNVEKTFAVGSTGSFGGDAAQAKGFDFSDTVNASAIGRSGVKWVEGTNQMILAYKTLAQYWKTKNASASSFYQTRADTFAARNADNAVSQSGQLGYTYADKSGAQVFSDNPYWKTAAGAAAASSAWVYFSLTGVNPFSI